MLSRLVCCCLPLLAVLALALPASVLAPALRDVPLLLSMLVLSLLGGTRATLIGGLLMGLAADILLHLPLGAYTLPLLALILLLTWSRDALLRQPPWQLLPVSAAVLFGWTWVLPEWWRVLGVAPIAADWLAPLIATLLWAPLLLLAQPPEDML